MRASLIAAAITVALGAGSLNAAAASADTTTATTQHHRHHRTTKVIVATASVPDLAAELAVRDREIAELKDQLSAVEAKVGAIEQRTDAQSDINVTTTKNVETLQAKADKVDALDKIVNDTTVGGRVFVDVSDIDQSKNGAKTAASGDGLDVKRAYITVAHQFNDIWSANLITDFNYVSADSETQLFLKNAYLQGKFSNALIFRAGEIPLTWTSYVEGFYGMRYVENTLTDKEKFANTADWGVNLSGNVDNVADYSVAAVNGGGYKNPTRTDRMDFEGRVGFTPIANTVVAVGGYSGTLGKETETTDALHTATRGDAMIAYAKGNTRIGGEYFEANNWNNVLTPLQDKAAGYSLWGSFGITDMATLFARYDNVDPSKDLNPNLKDTYYNFGVEWALRKGIKVAAVYKNDDLRDNVNDQKTQEVGIFGDIAF